MTSTRALEEKHSRILRDLLKEKINKRCFDCIQKGPVYANVTIGSFICTQCSGIHRELSHRVKSISMSTFTPQEIEKMKSTGNEVAEQEWRPNWDKTEYPLPDPSDATYLKRFIYMTYKDKVFLKKKGKSEEPKRSLKTKKKSKQKELVVPPVEPLASVLGNDIPHIGKEKQTMSSSNDLLNLYDTPPSNTPTGSTNKSSPLGDLSSLYAQGGTSYYNQPTMNQPTMNQPSTVNPFADNTNLFGNQTMPSSQNSQKIQQLQLVVSQLQEAINMRQQQITIGQQNYARLNDTQKQQLMSMMQLQQQQLNMLTENMQQLNSLTSQQQSQQQPQYNPFSQTSNGTMGSNSSWNYGGNVNQTMGGQSSGVGNFGQSNDPFSGLTTQKTDFDPFG